MRIFLPDTSDETLVDQAAYGFLNATLGKTRTMIEAPTFACADPVHELIHSDRVDTFLEAKGPAGNVQKDFDLGTP